MMEVGDIAADMIRWGAWSCIKYGILINKQTVKLEFTY